MIRGFGKALDTERLSRVKDYFGVIVRSFASEPCRDKDIEDGTSKTMMIGEKRIFVNRYNIGDWHDDIGWTDGWDPDIIRYTGYQPGPDPLNGGRCRLPFWFGHNSALTRSMPMAMSVPSITASIW